MKQSFLAVLLLFSLQSFSQATSVSGYWYGKASIKASNFTNNYLIELILRQEKTQVNGIINYYFKQTFRSMKVKGNYDSRTRELVLFNIPLTFHGSQITKEIDCT